MTTVFVSGVWDLFHVGHLWVLERASRLGDELIVGVVTDEMAVSYKGLPAIPYHHRVRIINCVACVDSVVRHSTFEGNKGVIESCDIRVVGPEFGVFEGQRRCLERYKEIGLRVVVVERPLKMSTTIIKEKIREKAVGSCDDFVSRRLSGVGSSDAASLDPRGYSE